LITTESERDQISLWYIFAINHIKNIVVTTETQIISENAKNMTSFYVATMLGLSQQKVWVTVGDDRVREFHREADGQEVNVFQPFLVGNDALMYPGDPSGSLSNIINCRCSSVLKGV